MKIKIIIISAILLMSCKVNKVCTYDINALSPDALLKSPFGHNESIASYKSNLPKGTKVVKMVQRNMNYPDRIDTIYSFNYKKSKIAVVKTYFNKEMVLGGNIENKEIVLQNGIRIGMNWADFASTFTNLNQLYSDTIVIRNEVRKRKLSFYFDKNKKLKRYVFNEYLY